MSLLLDTHAFLWFIGGDRRLSGQAQTAIESGDNLKFVSIASLWEVAIKVSLGKLHIHGPFGELIPKQMRNNGFDLLHIELGHLSLVSTLPFHHRDPFDRLLAAQCRADGLTVVSRDQVFDQYDDDRLW